MDTLLNYFDQLSSIQIILFGGLILLLWFLPVIIALFFNPKHAKYIAIACVPAGFSIIAWSALMVWAFTGKVWKKYQDKHPEVLQE